MVPNDSDITRKVGIGILSVSEAERGRIVSTSNRVVNWRYSAMRSTVVAHRSRMMKVQHGSTTVSSDDVQLMFELALSVVGIPTFLRRCLETSPVAFRQPVVRRTICVYKAPRRTRDIPRLG